MVGWVWGRKCEGPPQEAKWPLPGLFFSFAALVCVTTEKRREDPQLFLSLFKKGRGSMVRLWADPHFCSISPIPAAPKVLPLYSSDNFQVSGSWMSWVHTPRP